MEKTRDEIHHYHAIGGPAWCRLQVYRGADGAVVGIASEQEDNPGTSVTGWADQLASAVWQQEGEPAVFIWIEHYPAGPSPELGESFARVQFEQRPSGAFTTPRWHAVPRQAVEELLAQPTVGDPATWASVPPPRLRLDCTTCGQPLAISEVLTGARICAACAARKATAAAAGEIKSQVTDDLETARTAWLERTNAHEIRLGLTRMQRAALRAALVGPRSLWSLTAAELYAVVERLERFPSAGAVQAFLDEQGDRRRRPDNRPRE